MSSTRWRLSGALFLLASGCGDGGAPEDDAPTDMGVRLDAGDAGSAPDFGSGSNLTCDPIDDTGCADGEVCLVNAPRFDDGVCQQLAAEPVFLGEVCDGAAQDCGSGLFCAAFQGEPEPTCRRPCEVAGGRGCETLNTPHFCAAIQGGGGFGFCEPTCDIIAQEGCAEGEGCYLLGGSEPSCSPAGTTPLGGACQAPDECEPGATCVSAGDGPSVCAAVCDRDATDACLAEEVCAGLQDGAGNPLPFGFCLNDPSCDVFDPSTCPANQACALVTNADVPVCIDAGPQGIGEPCTEARCAPGGLCADVGGTGAVCRVPCSDEVMCPGDDVCARFTAPFEAIGVCAAPG